MAPDTIRYAIIGCGGIAGHHAHQLDAQPGTQPVGFQDISTTQLDKWKAKYPSAVFDTDAAQMLAKAKPNLVCICTPNSTHHPMTLLALSSGAHVMCEKPMAMTVDQALEMEAARAKASRLGAINFSYRTMASLRFARDIIASGELGRLLRINVVYLQSFLGAPATPHSWRNDLSLAGFGALGDLGVHMLDSVAFATKLTAKRAVGLSQVLIKEKTDPSGQNKPVTTDTNASFLVEYDSGVIGTFETTQVAPGYGNHLRIEISGTLGTLRAYSEKSEVLDLVLGSIPTRYATWKSDDLPRLAVPSGFVGAQPKSNLESFVSAIRNQSQDYPSFQDGIAAQKILHAILTSMNTHAWVTC